MQITVFTPTYNRGYIIEKLYRSLLEQTVKDFEWIVVDDGSTDNTEEIFKAIREKDNPFEISYIKQPNGGKHRAINRGVQLARGELFFIVDSDDYLTENAIEKIELWEKSLSATKKWAGVSGARGYSETQPIGGIGKGDSYIDAKNTQRGKCTLLGDKAEAYYTEILKQYPFPEFDGENFITEEVVWNAIANDGYYLRWYPDIIYICDYLDDGLTCGGMEKYKKNPQGVLYWAKQQLHIYSKNAKRKLQAVNFYYCNVRDKKSITEIAKDLEITKLYCKVAVQIAAVKRKFCK